MLFFSISRGFGRPIHLSPFELGFKPFILGQQFARAQLFLGLFLVGILSSGPPVRYGAVGP